MSTTPSSACSKSSVGWSTSSAARRRAGRSGSTTSSIATSESASLERVELLLRMEKELGVRLSDHVMEEAASPRDLVAAVIAAARTPEVLVAARPRLAPAEAAPASARRSSRCCNGM